MDTAEPKCRRRRFQFSLRTLLLVVTFATCGFGWLGYKVRQAQQQKEAVEAIRKLGGEVDYDYQLGPLGGLPQNPEFPLNGPALPGPAWLREMFGIDFLATPTLVVLKGPSFTDAVWLHLRGLAKVKYLTLYDTQITDAGLIDIQRLTELDALSLDGERITDAGLIHIQGLTHLKTLVLCNAKTTDACLVHLRGLTNLQELELNSNTLVTEKGCQELQKALPNLKILR